MKQAEAFWLFPGSLPCIDRSLLRWQNATEKLVISDKDLDGYGIGNAFKLGEEIGC